ncbi:MAG: PEP-CTERM sorting domain-containing protein [Bryobacteraceae bacterium]|jgi:hypothetical protein
MDPFNRLKKHVGFSAFLPIAFVLLTISPARANYSYVYVITARPNWLAYGTPQPVLVTVCTALAPAGAPCGSPGGASPYENYETLSILGGATYFAGDTFSGETGGLIGADISVPTAQWVAPVVYTWTAGVGGGVAFFNSYKNGVFYANELMVLDPAPSADYYLNMFAGEIGDLSPMLPAANTSLSPNSSGHVDVPQPSEGFAPEPSMYVPLLIGLLFLGGLYWIRRRADA